MNVLRGLLVALVALSLVACQSTSPQGSSGRTVSTGAASFGPMAEGVDFVSEMIFEGDLEALEWTARGFEKSLARDAEATADHVEGIPGWVAREFDEGIEALEEDTLSIVRNVARDARKLPAEIRRYALLFR
jgi:hypothetical protein